MKTIEQLTKELADMGLKNIGEIYYNLQPPALYEHAVLFDEALLSSDGALVVDTTPLTGRSAQDKFIVEEESSRDKIWWGEVNRPFPQQKFHQLREKVFAYLQGQPIYVQDCFAGASAEHRLRVRVITQYAWHSLFAQNMFIKANPEETEDFLPDFTVISVPEFRANPQTDGTRSEVFILLDFSQRLILIGGTKYGGEIKKSIFTVMNYLLPLKGVLSMHCSANVGANGDVALFFGLSGTGKTTLSTDPERPIIGDDEHGWDDTGVFNIEGGCYAKVINLSPTSEPIIYKMTRTFGTILENVVLDPYTREVDYADGSKTENTRACYSRDRMENIIPENRAGHPQNIFFLTADAFGVLPPIARLTEEQAMFHFLSGYTAKVAGTEVGIVEPVATFSTCFGAPFMVHKPQVYAELLREKIQQHGVKVWLVNTGWIGGPYGIGKRISIEHTRALLHAVLSGALNTVEFVSEPFFNLRIPTVCPGVPSEILNPRNAWSDSQAYDEQARKLHQMFEKNFEKFAALLPKEVAESLKSEEYQQS